MSCNLCVQLLSMTDFPSKTMLERSEFPAQILYLCISQLPFEIIVFFQRPLVHLSLASLLTESVHSRWE